MLTECVVIGLETIKCTYRYVSMSFLGTIMGRGRRLKSYLDYENALGDGIGVGYGQSYQPRLRAQDVKSRGNRSIVFGLKTFRNHHHGV